MVAFKQKISKLIYFFVWLERNCCFFIFNSVKASPSNSMLVDNFYTYIIWFFYTLFSIVCDFGGCVLHFQLLNISYSFRAVKAAKNATIVREININTMIVIYSYNFLSLYVSLVFLVYNILMHLIRQLAFKA